jgi:hypothetical protein
VQDGVLTDSVYAPSQNSEKRLLASSYLLDVIKQLGTHWKDFLKSDLMFFFFFENPLRGFVSLKYGKNNVYFTERVEKIKTYIL